MSKNEPFGGMKKPSAEEEKKAQSNLRQRKMYYKRKAANLCPKCGAAIQTALVHCEECTEKFREKSRLSNAMYRARYKKEGRCARCAGILDAEDEGFLTCINCRMHAHEGRPFN